MKAFSYFRTSTFRLAHSGVVIFVAQALFACASTNEVSPVSRLSQLALADRAGTTAYHSDRDTEVVKFLRGTNNVAAAKEKAVDYRKSQLLVAIPIPPSSGSVKDAIKTTKGSGRKYHEEGILPVWTGSEWTDGMPLALNGFSVPEEIRAQLMSINFQERAFGAYFWTESERRKRMQFSGFHPTDRFLLSRTRLENLGYTLKFDKTFYIWRITGTNAPAAKSP
ncbi:MAG: hypothetical protein ACOX7Q_11115 [Kiritimatiellia bacterium]